MNKSNLRTGMRIRCRDGWEAIAMLDVDNGDGFVDTSQGWLDWVDFDKNLCFSPNSNFDIMKIWECKKGFRILEDTYKGALIYERKEENMINIDGKEYSKSTIKKALKDYIGD